MPYVIAYNLAHWDQIWGDTRAACSASRRLRSLLVTGTPVASGMRGSGPRDRAGSPGGGVLRRRASVLVQPLRRSQFSEIPLASHFPSGRLSANLVAWASAAG